MELNIRKEFYFVRHGQTDHNIFPEQCDDSIDISLNKTGKEQANHIEPLIASLPIQTLCISPMKRARETTEIISSNLLIPRHVIRDLSECSMQVWKKMFQNGMSPLTAEEKDVRIFIEQVRQGMNLALILPGTPLIVAHGGVHWAICSLMGIKDYSWAIDNCEVAHFSIGLDGKWNAKRVDSLDLAAPSSLKI